jgi:hypothetical protein
MILSEPCGQRLPKPLLLACKVALAMALQPVDLPAMAQAPTANSSETASISPELFGVKVGTAAGTATRILQRRGFVLREREIGPSWFGQVGAQTGFSVKKARKQAVTATVMDGPAGEQLELRFVQTPSGAAVSRITAHWPDSVEPAALADAFSRRYGRAEGTVNTANVHADGARRTAVQPFMSMDVGARRLVLDAEDELRALEQQSIERAVRDCQRSRLGAGDSEIDFLGIAC